MGFLFLAGSLRLQLFQGCLLLVSWFVTDCTQEVNGLLTDECLEFGGQVEQGKALGDPALGTVEAFGEGSLAAMDGQEALQGPRLVKLGEVLAVDVGDEGGFKDFFGCGALVVADHHLDRGDAGFAGGGKAAAAVYYDVGGVWLEVGFTLRVGLDVGVAVHDRDGLLLAVGLETSRKIGEVSQSGAGVVRVEADAVDGELSGRGDALCGDASGCSDGLTAGADCEHSPAEASGAELIGLAHETSLAMARIPTACCDLGA
ncbi:UNVERIFIED_CONTAM: hypothetical protein RKD50_000127 [Streptomyces canus]